MAKLPIAYAGLNFYPKTPRFVKGKLEPDAAKEVKGIQKVGVFVNADKDYILEYTKAYGLDAIQLHGEESPEFCESLQAEIPVIKVFKIKEETDLAQVKAYEGKVSKLLFDTKGKYPGGNGIVFNWDLLQNYTGSTPFFLSGGIGPEQASALKEFEHPAWEAIDINSRFEDAPGKKNMDSLKQFLWDLNIM